MNDNPNDSFTLTMSIQKVIKKSDESKTVDSSSKQFLKQSWTFDICGGNGLAGIPQELWKLLSQIGDSAENSDIEMPSFAEKIISETSECGKSGSLKRKRDEDESHSDFSNREPDSPYHILDNEEADDGIEHPIEIGIEELELLRNFLDKKVALLNSEIK